MNKEEAAHTPEMEALIKENAYLRRAAQETTSRLMALETQSIAMRHELEQKRRGFSLMAELTASFGKDSDYISVFESVSRRINAVLNMQRTAVLFPDGSGAFKPAILHGYSEEEAEAISGSAIHADAELLEPEKSVLVTGADPESRLASFRGALKLPFLISSPIILSGEIAAILVTGRTVEQRPFLTRLGDSDVETVRTVSAYLAAMLAGQRMTEAEKRTQIMLDAMPLCCMFWDDNIQPLDCNEAAPRLFGMSGKEEFLERFWELSPKYQPDGRLSSEFAEASIKAAYEAGHARFEHVHQTPDGEPIPMEMTLVRVLYGRTYRVVAYMRDLRELNAMLAAMNKTQDELRLARDLAEKSAKTKSEFLANMSHEIRTPMNAVVGMMHLLNGTVLNDKQRGYVETAEHSARLLLHIINDILDFTKIEAGRMDMENIAFSLRRVAASVNEIIGDQAIAKGLEWSVAVADDVPDSLVGDPMRLEQVLINLANNAVKFTPAGSVNITVSLARPCTHADSIAELRFEVSDTGIGMSQKQLVGLFNPFRQADTSITRKFGGTGLGLAISRSLVELMRGEISCASELGKGSKFVFTARLGLADIENLDVCDDPAAFLKDIERDWDIKGVKVLLAEDNEINQMIAVEMLNNQGVEVDVVGTGLAALGALEQNSYDMVLMDIQMPEMDGLSATAKIRSNPKLEHLPIVAMTAHAMSGDREISLDAGMNDHLTKPINPQKLYAAIRRWGKARN